MDGKRVTDIFCLIGATLCYSTSPVFIRYFAGYLDGWTVNGIRYGIATCCLLPFLIFQKKSETIKANVETAPNLWKDALIPSIVNLIGQVAWGFSPYFVEASIMGFLSPAAFLFTIILGFMMIPQERLLGKSPLFWTGTLACIAGVVLMYTAKYPQGERPSILGMSILLIAIIFYGAYPVCVRRWMRAYPVKASFATVSLYTTFGLLLLMFSMGNFTDLKEMDARLWTLLVASSVIGIASSHPLYYRGIQGVGPIVAAGALKATPFLTLLGAMIFLKEKMSHFQFLGGVTIVIGAMILLSCQSKIKSSLKSINTTEDCLDIAKPRISS